MLRIGGEDTTLWKDKTSSTRDDDSNGILHSSTSKVVSCAKNGSRLVGVGKGEKIVGGNGSLLWKEITSER